MPAGFVKKFLNQKKRFCYSALVLYPAWARCTSAFMQNPALAPRTLIMASNLVLYFSGVQIF